MTSTRNYLLATSALALALVCPTVNSQIIPVVQESGLISVSADAEGNNDTTGGTIDVVKPTGATVRAAYLSAATVPPFVIVDGDVSLNGTPINWDMNVLNVGPRFTFNNVFADVTSVVKPVIDAAAAGTSSLPVTEVNTTGIDGTALLVIFDDPNVTENSSVIVLFGGQLTTGDTFVINLAQPIDPTLPGAVADMGLGITFGFQSSFGGSMVSEIDVNGTRLTSAAGGEDDGISVNGGLITFGGIGDSNANPVDPFAPPTSFASDDELYSLLPFVDSTSTQIVVDTVNPTDDDNVFFGYFVTSVPSAIGESVLLAPVSAQVDVGQTHAVTATVVDDNNNPIVGRTVNFSVQSGPNAGTSGSAATDAAGQAMFSYSSAVVGTDTLIADMTNSTGANQQSNTATVTWNPGQVSACDPEVFIAGTPRVGSNIELCARGNSQCAGCLMISSTPGPSMLGPYLIPIGQPILAIVPTGLITNGEICYRLPLVNPALSGQTFYISLVTSNGASVEFSPAATLAIP